MKSSKFLDTFFVKGPPELREQKDMMMEDIESYATELNKPMEKFGKEKGGKKIKTRKNKTKKTK